VLGDGELDRGVVGVKPLREAGEQAEVALDDLAAFFATRT